MDFGEFGEHYQANLNEDALARHRLANPKVVCTRTECADCDGPIEAVRQGSSPVCASCAHDRETASRIAGGSVPRR